MNILLCKEAWGTAWNGGRGTHNTCKAVYGPKFWQEGKPLLRVYAGLSCEMK
jgi:hypothetical protein